MRCTMLQLLNSSKAMELIKIDAKRQQFSHTYLASFQDSKYLKIILKEIAKIILQADSRVTYLIDTEQYIDCKIYPQDGKRILVEDVEAIIENSDILPIENEKKVFILNDVQNMYVAAQNKLLKLLEEPPNFVHFILGTTQQDFVLSTIRSRAKNLQFDCVNNAEMVQFIDRNYPNFVDKQSAVLLANGSISNLQQIVQEDNIFVYPHYILQKIATLQIADIPAFVKEYADNESACKFFASLQLVLHEILLYHIGNKKSTVLSHESNIEKQAENLQYLQLASKRYKPQRILSVIDEITQAIEDSKNNAKLSYTVYLVLLALLEGK